MRFEGNNPLPNQPPLACTARREEDVDPRNPGDVEVPELPRLARLPAGLGEDACPWLDRYVRYSATWAPRAYPAFHTGVGLWCLSTVAARRVVVHLGGPRYPSLYIALIGRSSLWTRSTVAAIGKSVLAAAGLDWLLAPDESTPQRFIADLAGRPPENFGGLSEADRERALARLALPAQRGWYYDEWGQQLEAMGREGPMREWRSMLRRLADCPESYEYATIARGIDRLRHPYLAFLGLATPADFSHLGRQLRSLWHDGFFARIAFITPGPDDVPSREPFPPGERPIPTELVEPLRAWHTRLGLPRLKVAKRGGSGDWQVVERDEIPLNVCSLDAAVTAAYYAYDEALRAIVARSTTTDTDASYARLPEKALRIAVLLASLENGGRIEMRHWARAQQIAETWRACLHFLWAQLQVSRTRPAEDLDERIAAIIQRHGAMTATEVARYIRGATPVVVAERLNRLATTGVVTRVVTPRGATRYHWTPATDEW